MRTVFKARQPDDEVLGAELRHEQFAGSLTKGLRGNAVELVQEHLFHPELLTTASRKTLTIANFQKARGVLRLLAPTMRELWQFLISPLHLNLGNGPLFLLERGW
jgi:predicted AAA+ superfamily ATPase